jgi:uncharacterized protein with FMN-binding domain
MRPLVRPKKQSSGKRSSKLMLSGALLLVSGAYAWLQHQVPTITQATSQPVAQPKQVALLRQATPPSPTSKTPDSNDVAPVSRTVESQTPPHEAQVGQPQASAVLARPPAEALAATTVSAPVQPEAPDAVASNAPTPITPQRNSGHYADGDFTGAPADTAWGLVQIRITVRSGAIAAVDPIDYPSHRRRSVQINSWALPILAREVIQAQSAEVDMVSQATTTSVGYLQSLSTALAQAKKSP